MSLSFSVIINTCNRAAYLTNCLRSLRQQSHSNFEVIVVNGPSNDGTKEVCERLGTDIKYLECKELNLSVSRNIGIRNSAGDICAFIDDDALAHPDWLAKIEEGYISNSITGVGGYTLDHTGQSFQAKAILCDRFAKDYPVVAGLDTDTFCFPETELYPSLLGTNSSFRREALLNIGGFDELFAYFLDETDVCLRLIENGGTIVYAPNALVQHGYASSHMRTARNIPRTRYYSVRSKVYFMLRHGKSSHTLNEIHDQIRSYADSEHQANNWLLEHGEIDKTTHANISSDIKRGVEDGVARSVTGLSAQGLLECVKNTTFLPYPTFKDKLTIAFISRSYPPDGTQGIARWTGLMASSFALDGHCVHVVAESLTGSHSTTFDDGIWIHRVLPSSAFGVLSQITDLCDVPASIFEWSAAAYSELVRQGLHQFDIISAPIWDVEGLVTMLMAPDKVVTSLHTTYAIALPFKPDWGQRPSYVRNHINPIIAAEKWVFENGNHFMANSQSILKEINTLYESNLNGRSIIVPHGIVDVLHVEENNSSVRTVKKVLFVGRQEYRKGFDTAIYAAINVCSSMPDVVFTFVGSACPSDSHSTMAISMIPQQMLGSRIIITGHVEDSMLDNFYRDLWPLHATSLLD